MIKVAAAIIVKKNKILIAKRKSGDFLGGKWEFPGGKLEEGETLEECLKRELFEEFQIVAKVGSFFEENVHTYGDKTIHLLSYETEHVSGEFNLNVHDDIAWITKEELDNYDFAEADIPFVKKLKNKNSNVTL